MFRNSFRQGSRFAGEMRQIDSDEQSREQAAQDNLDMMRLFEKMTSGEVIEDAELWPMAKAVAEAAVYAVEAILEERDRNLR